MLFPPTLLSPVQYPLLALRYCAQPLPGRFVLKVAGVVGVGFLALIAAPFYGAALIGLVLVALAAAQSNGAKDKDQQGEPHGQLREQVVERDREGKVQPVHS